MFNIFRHYKIGSYIKTLTKGINNLKNPEKTNLNLSSNNLNDKKIKKLFKNLR